MGDSSEENQFNSSLYNPFVVDLYESINNNNSNNISNNNNNNNNSNNEFSIPLSQSLQNLLPITPTTTTTTNDNGITSIDINLNQILYSTTPQQPIYPIVPVVNSPTSPLSPIDYNTNTNNNNSSIINNVNNNNNNNNNNLTNVYQDSFIQLQIQQLQQQLLQQQLQHQIAQQQQQQNQQQQLQLQSSILPLNNVQVPTVSDLLMLQQQHHNNNLLVPQQQPQQQQHSYFGNVSDNSSPDTNFSYGSPSPNSLSNYDSPTSPTSALTTSTTTITASTSKVTTSGTSPSSKSSSKEKGKEKEKEKEKDRTRESEEKDDDRPKKKKKFDKNVYIGVDLGDDLLEITSEEFQAYKNNFFANTNDKKTQSALNYQFRKIKNRESARRSRERKATHVDELETKITEIEKERDELKKENQLLRSELEQYKLQDKQKSATSYFDYVSIGSPTTQNFSKNFGIIFFLFLFGSFILNNTNPAFFSNSVSNVNNNNNLNNNNNNNNINSNLHFGGIQQNANRFPFSAQQQQQFFASQRNPLSNLDEESLGSIRTSQGVFNTHFVPQEPSILLNRESIRNWATLPQNSVASLSFEKDSALGLIEKANLDKSKHNVISSYKQLEDNSLFEIQDQETSKENNCNNSENNNNCENNNSNNSNDSNSENNGKDIEKTINSYPPTSSTRYVNNSTLSLLVEPRAVIGDNLLNKDSNATRLSGAYKFEFLIDSQNFPNGSNDISKAFLESSDDQQMTVTSVIIAIQKSPKQQQQQQQQPSANID